MLVFESETRLEDIFVGQLKNSISEFTPSSVY